MSALATPVTEARMVPAANKTVTDKKTQGKQNIAAKQRERERGWWASVCQGVDYRRSCVGWHPSGGSATIGDMAPGCDEKVQEKE